MAIVSLKIKVMPEQGKSLENLKKEIEGKIKKSGGKINSFEEQPIAFGLKALIVTIAWPEELATEKAESAIKDIEGVSSLDIIDYRRAFG